MPSKKGKDDPRFKIANREAIIGCVIAAANLIWWLGFSYGMGSKPVKDYDYIWGFPAWFFYSCILGLVVFTLVVAIVVKKVFKEIPLDDIDNRGDNS
ncbi:YhdT family protein [Tuberibacillus sp. Marseille-P3662]|uniref:YhdT family protein n=1 Tax=Tuberibacillus sp. Marseille-P3662 TaxID=1965358 RepID=UPI000A1CBB2B|nr:YhdT family protein [Tuberibacillus sp. Marseille-P3662]